MDRQSILNLLKKESDFYSSPIHGIKHWLTVERNGLHLANTSGADILVISYFALLHDCKRMREENDPGHGKRASEFAIKNRKIIGLDNEQFDKLIEACNTHTEGTTTQCPTIGTCWDADRLDLTRVGYVVRPELLHTKEAKRIATELDYGCLPEVDLQGVM